MSCNLPVNGAILIREIGFVWIVTKIINLHSAVFIGQRIGTKREAKNFEKIE